MNNLIRPAAIAGVVGMLLLTAAWLAGLVLLVLLSPWAGLGAVLASLVLWWLSLLERFFASMRLVEMAPDRIQRLPSIWQWACLAIFGAAVTHDWLSNLAMSVLCLQLPASLLELLSHRLKRYVREPQTGRLGAWRVSVATFFRPVLDAGDPTGAHL